MVDTEDCAIQPTKAKEEEVKDVNGFEELGLDPRLLRALREKGIDSPTPIQRHSFPLIIEGMDVVARAQTGSGKTFAYLLPMLQRLLSKPGPIEKLAPHAFILVPTRELCQQVYSEISYLIESCRVQLKVAQLMSSMMLNELKAGLAGPPDILVSTPASIPKCLSAGVLQAKAISSSLSMLVLDEADILLSYGYGDDIKALATYVPEGCQCLLMTATSSPDVVKLKKLLLHNPVVLKLPEVGRTKNVTITENVQQFWVSCSAHDKLLYILALLKLGLVRRKVLIFTNSIDMGFRLRLFLDKFGIRCAVLNADLPEDSRLHIIEEFDFGIFDYLIATDDSQTEAEEQTDGENPAASEKSVKKEKQKSDSEYCAVRAIDFKNVHTVINFELPQNSSGYVHQTGRAYSTGASISLVSPDEMEIFKEAKSLLGGDHGNESSFIVPFPFLTENAVESLRYRAEDAAKSVTKNVAKESKAEGLRNGILNSEKLKAHFEVDPRDLDVLKLKHDKVLSEQEPPSHMRVTKNAVKESKAEDMRNGILNPEKLNSHFEVDPRDLDVLKHDKVLTEQEPPSNTHVTENAAKESKAEDMRNEILNSEKLKAHFEVDPRDLDVLKHDKVLSEQEPPSHTPVTKNAAKESEAEDMRNEILNSEKSKAHFEVDPRDLDVLKHDKVLSEQELPSQTLVTKNAAKESKAEDMRNEISNSEKLKALFEVDPRDLDVLKHDKVLSEQESPSHTRVTKNAAKESKAEGMRNEILNSEKLKAHFEVDPRDLDVLKQGKVLSEQEPPSHTSVTKNAAKESKAEDMGNEILNSKKLKAHFEVDPRDSDVLTPDKVLSEHEHLSHTRVTKNAAKESKAEDMINEILNSEKLKAHFEVDPRDLDVLKHDKVLSEQEPPAHSCDSPDSPLDQTTQEASKTVIDMDVMAKKRKKNKQKNRKRKKKRGSTGGVGETNPSG